MKNKKKLSILQRKEQLVESMHLPKDLMLGASVITMTGNREVWIENYRGILEYTDTFILLQCKTCQICFSGLQLSIDYYTNEDMKISGIIHNVEYR